MMTARGRSSHDFRKPEDIPVNTDDLGINDIF